MNHIKIRREINDLWKHKKGSNLNIKIIRKLLYLFELLFPKKLQESSLKYILKILSYFFRIINITNQIRLNCFQLTGIEKHSKKKVKIILYSNVSSVNSIKNIFNDKFEIKKIKETYIWHIKNEIDDFSSKIDAVFIRCDKFYSEFLKKKKMIILPEWIEMKYKTPETIKKLEDSISSSAQKDIKKIKKHNYSYKLTTETNKLRFFFDEMYLPYLLRRHNQSAECMNFQFMRCKIKSGHKLMLIKEKDKYVSGSITYKNDDNLTCRSPGVYRGEQKYLKQGASAALYYFPIIYAIKRSINHINFGACNPFLKDGVIRYKKKWNMKIKHADPLLYPNIIGFILLKKSEPIQSFLTKNPLITIDDEGKFHGIIFVKSEEQFNDQETNSIKNGYCINGISKYSIISIDDVDFSTHKKIEN